MLGFVQLVFVNVWWPFNLRFQRATELVFVMVGLLLFASALAIFVHWARFRSVQCTGTARSSGIHPSNRGVTTFRESEVWG